MTVYPAGSLHLECRVFLEARLCSNHPLLLEDQGNQDSEKGTGQWGTQFSVSSHSSLSPGTQKHPEEQRVGSQMTVGRKKHNRAAGQGCQPASHLTSDEEGRTRKILAELFPVRTLLLVSQHQQGLGDGSWGCQLNKSPAETGGSKDTGMLWEPNDVKRKKVHQWSNFILSIPKSSTFQISGSDPKRTLFANHTATNSKMSPAIRHQWCCDTFKSRCFFPSSPLPGLLLFLSICPEASRHLSDQPP